jgi:hypothetical protein
MHREIPLEHRHSSLTGTLITLLIVAGFVMSLRLGYSNDPISGWCGMAPAGINSGN